MFSVISNYTSKHRKSSAHHHKPVKHHSTPHKNHHSVQKAPPAEPGALKNIILHKTLSQQATPQNPQVRASLVSTLVNKAASQDRLRTVDTEKEKGAVQATGRAILVHTGNSGEGHVVQGKSRAYRDSVTMI